MSQTRWDEIYDWAGLRVCDWVHENIAKTAHVLDVGAGQGKYRILLRDFPNVDGVEIHEKTVDRHDLTSIYRHVYVGDVCALLATFDVATEHRDAGHYDLMIFGDVLEHIAVDHAQTAIRRALRVAHEVLVIVPYLYPQEPHDDNEYQRHIQDDLTPELMCNRYPGLRLIMLESRGGEPFKGIYRGRQS